MGQIQFRALEEQRILRRFSDVTSPRGDRQVRCEALGLTGVELTLDYARGFPPIVTLFDGPDEVRRWGWDRPDGFAEALAQLACMREAAHG